MPDPSDHEAAPGADERAATPSLPDELTITLRKPVEHAGISYATMTLREPTGAQWLEWDKLDGLDRNLTAITVISGMPKPAVAKIGVRDLREAQDYLNAFFY